MPERTAPRTFQAPDSLLQRFRGRPLDIASGMARRLTYGYMLGLGLLAAFTLGSGWTLTELLERQRDSAAIINVAGAQRMLSQRIAALAPVVADPAAEGHQEAAIALGAAAARMRAAHERLLTRVVGHGARDERLLQHYLSGPDAPGAAVPGFLDRAGQLLRPGDPDRAAATAREVRALALGPLLAALETAVGLHEAAATRDVQAAQDAHHLTLLLALLVLLGEATLIFRPLVRHARRLAERLDMQARTDPLTGLLNRRAVKAALAEIVAAGGPATVVAIDLDHFKRVNDTVGHDAGDAVLCAMAERLRYGLRGGDLVGRMGGDEFVAILPGLGDAALAADVLGRLGASLNQPMAHAGRLLPVGATLGYALLPADGASVESILQDADLALIRAKQQARGSLGRSQSGDGAEARRDAILLRELRGLEFGALDGVTAHFQPIVSLDDGEVLGLEALARWHHPECGDVPPERMFKLAGQVGLAPALSAQVRQRALEAYAGMLRDGLAVGGLSFNLSAQELQAPGIIEGVERAILAAGVDPRRITIEITEDVLLEEVSPATLDRLVALRALGVRLALDDFGIGTSGLAQLLRLPLDTLKLDRTFTRQLGEDGRSEQVIRGALRLAQSLRLDVVIEGVETAAQAAALAVMGCERAQGWHFARAMPAGELRGWLERRPPQGAQIIPLRRALPAE